MTVKTQTGPINDHEAVWHRNDSGTRHALRRPTRAGAEIDVQDPTGANVITGVVTPGTDAELPFVVSAFMHDDGSILVAVLDEAHVTTCTFHRLKCVRCTLKMEFKDKDPFEIKLEPIMASQ